MNWKRAIPFLLRFIASPRGIKWIFSRDSISFIQDIIHPPKLVSTPIEYFKLYNDIAEKYPESEYVYSLREGKQREEYVSNLISKLKGLTLDLGCNDSHYAKFIENYYGTDIAKSVLVKSHNVVQSIAQQLPYRNNSFDNVFITEVLEHIPEREQVISEIFRILKSKGTLIVTVPLGNSPNATYSPQVLTHYGIEHQRYLHGEFSEEFLSNLLHQAGFINIKTETPFWFQLIAECNKP